MLPVSYQNIYNSCLEKGLFLVLAFFLLFPSPVLAEDIPGCSASQNASYTNGFVEADFIMENTAVSGNKIILNTGAQVINPDRIVIPFTQEVSVTFIYEGAGYVSDFGWMFYEDGVDAGGNFLGWGTIPLAKKRLIFSRILDDAEQNQCCGGGNGILDTDYANGSFPTTSETALATYNDGSPYKFKVDNDGVLTPKDMKKSIGIITGGKEIVFWLTADKRYTDNNSDNVFFTKKNWNPDVYNAKKADNSSCGTGTFNKWYYLSAAKGEGGCTTAHDPDVAGWLANPAITRLRDTFGIELQAGSIYKLPVTVGQKFSHAIVGAPPNDPNQWILGMEDLMGGGDSDHNDMVFRIERQTGGTASLTSAKAITVAEDDYYTSVDFEVYDNMPGGACVGKTNIKYSVSIDNGAHWVTLFNRADWDVVREVDKTGAIVANWTFGAPPVTYRSRKIDFAGLGMVGGALIWKADLSSNNEACVPEIINVALKGTVATHSFFSRASPSVQTNMLFSGSYETPARSWIDKKVLRGHLNATRLYDPADPTSTPQTPVAKWDAGTELNAMSPADRNIYYPSITMHVVTNEEIGRGDGVNKHFTGTLAHRPISATTVVITDQTETFTDSHTDLLTGNSGGSGTLNRFTGQFDLTFTKPPGGPGGLPPAASVPVLASYTYYTTSPALNAFTTANVTNVMLGLDNTKINATDYKYDFNNDLDFTEADGDWLVNWVRGFQDGAGIKKEWLLGPIDHSVPAVQTPPGIPAWYYGSLVTKDERDKFDKFVKAQWRRDTMVYVGSRDGMLHAFDGGKFRWGYLDIPKDQFVWGDNPKTTTIKESRGYYEWSGSTSDTALYGTGQEKWAFIPANLLSRLKNNAKTWEDQAYLDASPAISDVTINGVWKTVLLSAEGNGGDTVFCLDVTNPLSPTFMWEFADPDLFRSQSSPAVAITGRIYPGKWVAFFVSGKTFASKYPSIYMIDIATGDLIQRIYLDSEPNGIEGVPSGQPSAVDSDGNGYIDRIYIGTNKGYLYKVDIPDNLTVAGNITNCVINTDFSDNFGNTVVVGQQYHPIYASPAVMVQNTYDSQGRVSAWKTNVLFGTGDSPYFNDNINTGATKYHFFAYADTAPKGTCTSGTVSLDWVFELPAGERIFASAFAAAKTVYFGTSTGETEDPCEGNGIVGSNLGKLRAMDINQTGPLTVKFTHTTGNIVSAPVVDDNHLYVKASGRGLLTTAGPYNNPAAMAGLVESAVATWREIFDQNESLRP